MQVTGLGARKAIQNGNGQGSCGMLGPQRPQHPQRETAEKVKALMTAAVASIGKDEC